ncbi:hypothetical protein [Streptomyces sp. NPDC059209]|uniref:hypothetical protein n=1 Tax=Streptomyces sp. NPDC059209 TaxID=3346769 RepID=UPI0036CD322C
MRYPITAGLLAAVALGMGSLAGCGSEEGSPGVPEGAYESGTGKGGDGLKSLTLPPPECRTSKQLGLTEDSSGRKLYPTKVRIVELASDKITTQNIAYTMSDGAVQASPEGSAYRGDGIVYDECDVESTLYTGQNTTEFLHGKIPSWERCDTELDEDRDFDGGKLMSFQTEAVEELVGEELCLMLEKRDNVGKAMLFYVRFDEARAPHGPGDTPTIRISYKQLT